MTLKSLLNIHGKALWRELSDTHAVKGLSFDSRTVEDGFVYVAIRGTSGDGHRFISDAVNNGAIGLIVEDSSYVPDFFKGVSVEVLDSRLALQILSQRFYGQPGDQLTGVAVTGTNGKTSFSYILEHLLGSLNYDSGVIGTIDHHYKGKTWETELTTPDPVTLQKRLKDFLDLGAKAFIVEASSHALKQNRINQSFDICVFTNLSRDHMDYHTSEEDYFMSKAKLFSEDMLGSRDGFAIINGDDPMGERLAVLTKREVFLYGEGEHCDFLFKALEESLEKTVFQLKFPDGNSVRVESPLLGKHNIYNLVAALASVYVLNLNYQKSIDQISSFKGIPGRLQIYRSPNKVSCFVDYAHTDDALRKVLNHLRKLQPKGKGRILTVFGCGGDRDKTKRKFMGQVAKDLSDIIFVTSDNPRTEDPRSIIEDICINFNLPDELIIVEEDREKAILLAAQESKPGDIILVAGKGHEDYQIIGSEKKDFSDYENIVKAFEG